MADDFYFADVDRTQRGAEELGRGLGQRANRQQQNTMFLRTQAQREQQQQFEQQMQQKAFGRTGREKAFERSAETGTPYETSSAIETGDDQSRFAPQQPQGTVTPSNAGMDTPGGDNGAPARPQEPGGVNWEGHPRTFLPQAQQSQPQPGGQPGGSPINAAAQQIFMRTRGAAAMKMAQDQIAQSEQSLNRARSLWASNAYSQSVASRNEKLLMAAKAGLQLGMPPDQIDAVRQKLAGSWEEMDPQLAEASERAKAANRQRQGSLSDAEREYLKGVDTKRQRLNSMLRAAQDPIMGDPEKAQRITGELQKLESDLMQRRLKTPAGDAAQPGEAASGRNTPEPSAVPGTGQSGQNPPEGRADSGRRQRQGAEYTRLRKSGVPEAQATQKALQVP